MEGQGYVSNTKVTPKLIFLIAKKAGGSRLENTAPVQTAISNHYVTSSQISVYVFLIIIINTLTTVVHGRHYKDLGFIVLDFNGSLGKLNWCYVHYSYHQQFQITKVIASQKRDG